jgi:hypothetical protein
MARRDVLTSGARAGTSATTLGSPSPIAIDAPHASVCSAASSRSWLSNSLTMRWRPAGVTPYIANCALSTPELSVSATRRSTQKLRDANSWRASLAAADTAAASIAEPSLLTKRAKRRGECTNVAQRAQCFISTSLART